MELGLSGKKALITGSTKGIGRAIVESLMSEGVEVAICARNAEEVEKAIEDLSGKGRIIGSAVDAGDSDSLTAWVTSSIEELGGIDAYVHNTSAKGAKSLDAWENNFNVDLMALLHAVEAAKEQLSDGGGSLVSIGTTAAAEHFGPGAGSYSAFKAAVTNRTQVLGKLGIRSNVVSPGPIFVDGGDWDSIKERMPEFFEATEAAHPGGAMGVVSDVANVVTFLASDKASHINGVNITVDGGFSKRVDY
ncbi:MAG: SDR family oxidoreductase [Acidimicrobiales bacterium]|nr:SDR family oxidoreductase [Acidimicrobiales bacterium]